VRYGKDLRNAFDTSRVIWASDWPPLDLASDYPTWKRISDPVLQLLPSPERVGITAGTAMRVYRINS